MLKRTGSLKERVSVKQTRLKLMSFPSGSTTIIVTPWFSLFSQLDHSILAVDDAYELKERSEFESFLKLAAKGAIPFLLLFWQ